MSVPGQAYIPGKRDELLRHEPFTTDHPYGDVFCCEVLFSTQKEEEYFMLTGDSILIGVLEKVGQRIRTFVHVESRGIKVVICGTRPTVNLVAQQRKNY